MQSAPGDPAPYLALVKYVYGPDHDMHSARQAIEQAIAVGNNDPYILYLALADAAEQARDVEAQENALKDAAAERPQGSEVLLALGEFYLNHANFDRAAITLQQAADAEPSARAWFDLGRAQEGAFNYFEADKAYAQAVAFDPNNPGNRWMTSYYNDFKRRLAKEEAAQARELTPQPAASPSISGDD